MKSEDKERLFKAAREHVTYGGTTIRDGWLLIKDNEGHKAEEQHLQSAKRKKILLDRAQKPFQNDNKVEQYYKCQGKFFS